jgi:acyl-CoA hydrolase
MNTENNLPPVKAADTYTLSTHFVLPNDTNTLGNLMGGQLLNWMDIAGAISAHRHCRKVVVTASVGNVSFQKPIKLGDIVSIEAKVSRSFSTSMEVVMDVFVENHQTGEKTLSNQAMFTFVALDQKGKTQKVPALMPSTKEETTRYEGALRRRQLSLVIAGKMNPDDASELKALFD